MIPQYDTQSLQIEIYRDKVDVTYSWNDECSITNTVQLEFSESDKITANTLKLIGHEIADLSRLYLDNEIPSSGLEPHVDLVKGQSYAASVLTGPPQLESVRADVCFRYEISDTHPKAKT